ncbi:MAG: thioredoxin family protein [Syntrophales bacterium]|jgi:hypothetical protein|nr:thioredoxin family protein [Syntrophales bacterium]MDY0045388.1 thioredoxin family protein [Syntrophales bacterium]
MRGSDVMQIRIKGNLIGIISLEKVMEEIAPDYARRSDEEIGSEMIKRISTKNYIPSSAENHYAIALVREFKRFMGQPVEEEAVSGIRALVLGPGCAQCSRLEMDVREVMAEMKVPGEIIHVSDIREIGKYGVMGAPALIINEKVVSVGTTPDKSKIRRWLEEAAG